MSNFTEICPVGAALIHADRRTDRRTTEMMDVKHSFRNYANSPDNYLMWMFGQYMRCNETGKVVLIMQTSIILLPGGAGIVAKKKRLSQVQSSMFTNPNILFLKVFFYIPNPGYSEYTHSVTLFECFSFHITWLSWKGANKVLSDWAI